MRPRVALWLVPAEPWHARLAARIAALAHEQSSLPFEPHITVHVGEAEQPQALAERLMALGAQTSRIALRAGPSKHSAEHFKTLFVDFDDPRLQTMQSQAATTLGLSTGYVLQPHLSLLYCGGLAVETRRALMQAQAMEGTVIEFDRLVLVRPPPGQDLSDQRGWNTDLRCVLSA